MITAANVTDELIVALRDEARAVVQACRADGEDAGDMLERLRACNAALGIPVGDGALGTLDTQTCRARVAAILDNARQCGTLHHYGAEPEGVDDKTLPGAPPNAHAEQASQILNDALNLFRPGARGTIVVRPRDGSDETEIVVGNDGLLQAIEAIQRRQAAIKTATDPKRTQPRRRHRESRARERQGGVTVELDRFDRMLLAAAPAPRAVAETVPVTPLRALTRGELAGASARPVVVATAAVITSIRGPRYVDFGTCPMCGVDSLGIEFHGVLMSGVKVHTLCAHAAGIRRVPRGEPRCLGAGLRVVFENGAWKGASS